MSAVRVALLAAFATFCSCLTHSALAQQFHGYDCTDDCSGHEAGYQWAEDHDIDEADDCSGKSRSFIEGCLAYVRDQNEQIDCDSDGDPDDCD